MQRQTVRLKALRNGLCAESATSKNRIFPGKASVPTGAFPFLAGSYGDHYQSRKDAVNFPEALDGRTIYRICPHNGRAARRPSEHGS